MLHAALVVLVVSASSPSPACSNGADCSTCMLQLKPRARGDSGVPHVANRGEDHYSGEHSGNRDEHGKHHGDASVETPSVDQSEEYSKASRQNLLFILSDESIVDSGDCACESLLSQTTATVTGSAQTSGDTVMFVHYHKTGCELSRQLLNLFFHGQARDGPLSKRAGGAGYPCPSLVSQTEHRKFVQTAPDLNACTAGSTFPPATKVVHFLRDPYKMAVSAYVYHTQDPTPEDWVHSKIQSCAVDGQQLLQMSQAFGLDIEPVRQLFASLNDPNASFYENLKVSDRVQGLRLWTAFAICSDATAAGGDLLRMPYNVRWLAESKMPVHNIYMDDWIAQTQEEFSDLHDFLGVTSIPREIDQVKQQSIFHPAAHMPSHVTQGILSQTEKSELIEALRADIVLRPFLDLMGRGSLAH